jgi:serine/threonine-protein kinase
LIDFGLTVPAEKEFMQPGIRTGTPNYMAPEVVRRRPTDKRLDIFSFGVSMYELFAFDLPWQRGTDGRAAMAHGMSAPPPLSKFYPTIDKTLEAAIHKCIESEPDKRFQSIGEFLKAIKRVKHEDA